MVYLVSDTAGAVDVTIRQVRAELLKSGSDVQVQEEIKLDWQLRTNEEASSARTSFLRALSLAAPIQ